MWSLQRNFDFRDYFGTYTGNSNSQSKHSEVIMGQFYLFWLSSLDFTQGYIN